MRTDGQTIRGNEMEMGKVKALAKRTFSKERMAVVAGKLVVAGHPLPLAFAVVVVAVVWAQIRKDPTY